MEGQPKIELGKHYRDKITGFDGTATARYEYLHGCVRWNLTRAHPEHGGPQDAVFDEPQLEAVEAEEHEGTGSTGGPHDDPPARPAPLR